MTIIVNGFLGALLVTNGYGSSSPAVLVFFTDPDLASLIGVKVASVNSFEVYPDGAMPITVAVANPQAFETDPDTASLILV